jgi:uncharacterized protein YbjT (DUF2867 family)
MTTVLVTGGTGDLGSKLVRRFARRGDTVRVLSRKPKPADGDPSVGRAPSPDEWAQGDMETGEGLAQAVAGVDLVIHAATGAGLRPKADAPGTQNLLTACKAAGTPHFFYISIVGIEKIPLGYYKAKLECEQIIEASGVPWSNLRATQFHSLLDGFLRDGLVPALGKVPFVRLVPKAFKFQPIETSEVADRMVEYSAAGPSGRLPDLGGPEVLKFGDMADAWKKATGDSKPLMNMLTMGGMASAFKAGHNCTPEHAEGKLTWAEWLQGKYGAGSKK